MILVFFQGCVCWWSSL